MDIFFVCQGNFKADNTSQPDQDLIRAKNLLELFGMKDRFKQMGTIGLTRSKQEVEAVIAKYARMELEERENVAAARHLGVPST